MERCLVTVAENRAAARIEKRDSLLDLAYGTLICQYMAATLAPMAKIPTPACVDSMTAPERRALLANQTLVDVLSDQLAGRDSDSLWCELVGVLVNSQEGREFLRGRAKEYAAFHAEEAAYGEAA